MASIESCLIENVAQALKEKIRIRVPYEPEIVTAKSERYQQSIARWSSAAEEPAAMVVYPVSEDEICEIVLFAADNGIELAVCGGGHATSTSSSTNGGICIDLSRLNEVLVKPKENIVIVEGGALWADVDRAAAKHGLAVVGGTVNTTGVGGLTLGGGYGYLVGEHGLVIDNLLEVTMILASGKIVRTTAFKKSDLFWAVRGAGASFGIILTFTFKAYELNNPVWGGTLVIEIDELDKVVAFANEFFEILNPKSALIWGFKALTADTFGIVAAVFYNGPEPDGTALFRPLLKLRLLSNTAQNRPYWTMNTLFNEDLRSGHRRSMKGSAFFAPLDLEFVRTLLDDFRLLIFQVPDAFMSMMIFEFLPYHKIKGVEQEATAFANRGAYGNLLWIMGWSRAENDVLIRQWVSGMSSKARVEFEKEKARDPKDYFAIKKGNGVGEYSNYDGFAFGGITAFGKNYGRLQHCKWKYDRNNVFSKGPHIKCQVNYAYEVKENEDEDEGENVDEDVG